MFPHLEFLKVKRQMDLPVVATKVKLSGQGIIEDFAPPYGTADATQDELELFEPSN